MTCINRENFSFLRKQSLLCASSGFSFRFVLQGVNRTLFPWVLNVPVQILRVA